MLIGKTVNNQAGFFSTNTEPKNVCILPSMVNRHGIISGLTGVGKTTTLRVVVEELSKIGVPCLVTDIKGDLSTIAERGETPAEKIAGWKPHTFPTHFWDVFGKSGEQLQTTIEELGTLLLARMLELTAAQATVLSVVFDVAASMGKKVMSLDHVLEALRYLRSTSYKLRGEEFGTIPGNSVSVIQRKIFELRRQGGESFFNSSGFSLEKMIQTKRGEGVINILHSVELVKYPRLYATFVIWILTKLYDELPEIGNPEKPKFVLFIDEAHLLFSGIQKNLLEKIQQAIRLIRSKGVGVFLITQNPADIPDCILGQIGNRVQHSLFGYTPRERRNIKVTAESFPPNDTLDIEHDLTSMAVGEALVSFLDASGRPQPTEKVKIRLPQSKI